MDDAVPTGAFVRGFELQPLTRGLVGAVAAGVLVRFGAGVPEEHVVGDGPVDRGVAVEQADAAGTGREERVVRRHEHRREREFYPGVASMPNSKAPRSERRRAGNLPERVVRVCDGVVRRRRPGAGDVRAVFEFGDERVVLRRSARPPRSGDRFEPGTMGVPPTLAHRPWRMSDREQARYGVELGADYPQPMLDIEARYGELQDAR